MKVPLTTQELETLRWAAQASGDFPTSNALDLLDEIDRLRAICDIRHKCPHCGNLNIEHVDDVARKIDEMKQQ